MPTLPEKYIDSSSSTDEKLLLGILLTLVESGPFYYLLHTCSFSVRQTFRMHAHHNFVCRKECRRWFKLKMDAISNFRYSITGHHANSCLVTEFWIPLHTSLQFTVFHYKNSSVCIISYGSVANFGRCYPLSCRFLLHKRFNINVVCVFSHTVTKY